MPTAFAPLISDGPILILVLFLLSTVPDNFIVFLRIGGGLFLLYLAFRAFKSWQDFDANETISTESSQQTLFKAVFINLLTLLHIWDGA